MGSRRPTSSKRAARRAVGLAIALGVLLLLGCEDSPTRPPQLDPLPGSRLSSAYGPRALDPVTRRIQVDGHHDGYDLAAAAGTPIRASRSGRVVSAGKRGGYGNAVELAHEGGWSTLYGHASRLIVKPGQWVKAGQVIGYVGSTGHSTGPHLHYELREDGRPVDPLLAAVRAKQDSIAPRKTARGSGKLKVARVVKAN